MCGIVGLVGLDKSVDKVVTGLESLEYRGYDSAGVAWISSKGIEEVKTVGRVSDLQLALHEVEHDSTLSIGHTRWATHGQPLLRNAHPQLSFDGKIALVHNGIIDNFELLKSTLISKGIEFSSDTDSEVVAHLIALHYQGNLVEAVEKVLVKLDGTFALAIVASDQPDLIVGAKRGSPLAVGKGEGFSVLASDAIPIIPYTRQVVFLEDEQVVVLTSQSIDVREGGKSIPYNITQIDWSAEAAQKNGYEHFMLKEIFEQPTVLENMVRSRIELPENGSPIFNLEELSLTSEFLQGVSRIVMIAQGTAYHACMIGRNMLERVTRIPTYHEYAADFRYRDPILDPSVLVIAVTQSGETMDTLHAVKLARLAGCKVISLVNTVGSSIARESDAVFYLDCGPEIGVASTKAFTAMLAGLYLLALTMGKLRRTISVVELRRRAIDLLGVGHRLQAILASAEKIKHLALKYKDATNFIFLGRGTGWALAMEGALKLKEVSYIHAEGYDAAEMKHGPIALVDENMPLLFIALQGRRYEKIIGNIQEVKARKGRVIALASHTDKEIKNLVDDAIYIRADSGIVNSICCSIPLQLLSYYIAVARGCDVDKPKNLAKSVTVE